MSPNACPPCPRSEHPQGGGGRRGRRGASRTSMTRAVRMRIWPAGCASPRRLGWCVLA